MIHRPVPTAAKAVGGTEVVDRVQLAAAERVEAAKAVAKAKDAAVVAKVEAVVKAAARVKGDVAAAKAARADRSAPADRRHAPLHQNRRRPLAVRALAIGLWATLAFVTLTAAADRYVRAAVDSSGNLIIVNSDGRALVVPKEPDQVAFDHITIAGDGSAVGWLALYPNGSTSYPIPLKLLVYSQGVRRTYPSNGLPVMRWHFTRDNKRIAFEQETVHGASGVHYELRDIGTGRLVSEYTPTVGPDLKLEEVQHPPQWAIDLDAAHGITPGVR